MLRRLTLPLLSLVPLACGGSDGAAGPRPCMLVTQAELEAITKGPLEPLVEERDTCRTQSPAATDVSLQVIVSLRVFSFESSGNATSFYDSVVSQTPGTNVSGVGERAHCSEVSRFAGAGQEIMHVLAGERVLQVSLLAPSPTCDMTTAVATQALSRL